MRNAYTDGAVRRGNPGIASAGFVVYNEDGTTCWKWAFVLDNGTVLRTNNEAEYAALIDLLQWAEEHEVRNMMIHCDSKLVVETVNLRSQTDMPHLKSKVALAYGLLVRGQHVLRHIHGHSGYVGNELADKLCNEVLDEWEKKNGRTQSVVPVVEAARS